MTVQGTVKKQQPNGMSQRGAFGGGFWEGFWEGGLRGALGRGPGGSVGGGSKLGDLGWWWGVGTGSPYLPLPSL